MACAGDVPTLETLAAVSLLRTHLPDLKVRVVNVVDLMRLQPDTEHPHGLSDRDYDTLFTADKPVIFAYHGYPWLIHRLTYRRHGHDNLHVRGYKEEGTVTTPFDMVVLNDMDRFHLVMDVIDRVPGLGANAALVRQHMVDARAPRRVHARVRRRHARGARLEVAGLTPARLMRVLVVNAGSSSLKLRVLGDHDEVEAEHDVDRWDASDDTALAGGARLDACVRRRRASGRARRQPVPRGGARRRGGRARVARSRAARAAAPAARSPASG